MIVLIDNDNVSEVRSTISMLTKHRQDNITNIILHRHGQEMDTMSVMGIANDDFSIIIPMYNWDVGDIRMYINSPLMRMSIDILTDSEFAFFYTRGRRVTWRKTNSKFVSDKSAKHDDSILTALNAEVTKNSQN